MRHVDALSRNPVPNSDYDNLNDTREFEVMNITTTEWLQTVQMTDSKLKLVRDILDSNVKDIKDIVDNYTIKDNKIYRKVGNDLKWVVPTNARWRVCQLNHDEAGHFSVDKTLDKIKQYYWFPKMNRFVRKYVSACLNCAHNKASTAKASGLLHPIPKGNIPFHTLHMDHLGPFVRSRCGNTYILGIIDGFSKFIFIRAVKNLKSKTTIKNLKDVFSMVGSPKVIISDRGTSFTSVIFEKYVKSIGARHVLNAVATPRANGQIEKYNRTILESIAASNHGLDERDWDKHITTVQWSLNNTRNKSTGVSPSEIIFGQRTVNPTEGYVLNAIKDTLSAGKESIESSNDLELDTQTYTNRLTSNLHESENVRDAIRNLATANIEKKQTAMKKRYDCNKAPTKLFSLGDLEMIPNYHIPASGKSRKLCPKFKGPFKISAVLQNDRYEISSIDGHSKRKYKSIYPADSIKKWVTFTNSDKSDHDNETNSGDSSNDE